MTLSGFHYDTYLHLSVANRYHIRVLAYRSTINQKFRNDTVSYSLGMILFRTDNKGKLQI